MGLGVVWNAAVAGLLPFIAGAGELVFTTLATATLQVETPEALRGRLLSEYNLVYNGTTPPGALVIGWLIEAAGLPAALGITGGIGLAATVGVFGGLLSRWRRIAG